MKAWIYILIGVALLKFSLVGSDTYQVEQKLADVQSQWSHPLPATNR